MNAAFVKTSKGTCAYIQKKVRVDGKSTTLTIRKLGELEDIRREHGCADPVQWVRDLAARMTEDEKKGSETVTVELSPVKLIEEGRIPLRSGGDLMLYPTYSRLGLDETCGKIAGDTRIKYNLAEILRTLVFGRILSPDSKLKTFGFAKRLVFPPSFGEHEMYRALSALTPHINEIQASVYRNTKKFMNRRERVIYFDCTNYYFEIEDNDSDYIDKETGEFVTGLRKRGKSKENRPNPIVQMGMFMDGDGIPLAFNIFSGNESEQLWLQPLEETLEEKFGLTDFIVSTDAGLASEDNRRFNMAEGRDYICVQSLPSLRRADQDMAVAPEGWRVSFCGGHSATDRWPTDDPEHEIFNLSELLKAEAAHPGLLRDSTLYKEIMVEKTHRYVNPQWTEMEREDPGARHIDKDGKPVPQKLSVRRDERIIVTYNHDFALYLKHKRQERLRQSEAIVRKKDEKGRRSQQSPRKYVMTVHKTKEGEVASKVEMSIDDELVKQEERLDGFYGFGTSLEDDAVDILKARSFHHEIEHIFRTTKSILDARPVYVSRPDRIKSHFLTCFLAMVVLKILQKQLMETYDDQYRDAPLSIDSLVSTLQDMRFGELQGRGYVPMYTRTKLTDQLQEMAGVKVNTHIITPKNMRKAYRSVK